jgi:hypothetical protein
MEWAAEWSDDASFAERYAARAKVLLDAYRARASERLIAKLEALIEE